MKSKEELIEIMAEAIGSNLNGHLFDNVELQVLRAADAALKALCGALPDVHTEHKDKPEKNLLNTVAECAMNYCKLVEWGAK